MLRLIVVAARAASAGIGSRVLSLCVLSLCLLSSCSEPLSNDECERLLDHYTERLMRDESPDVSLSKIAEKQEQARKLAKEDPLFEFERCSDKVSRSQFDCAMAAGNVNGIEQCLML